MSTQAPEAPGFVDAQAWHARGRGVEVDGHRLFYVDTGGDDLPVMVILHGYPTSSYDYWRALPLLSARYRVIVHDHLGFGYSEKPRDYSYSLMEQTDTALGLWRALGVTRAHVVAHDYGTSIATELLARHQRGLSPLGIESLSLSNGSMHIELARLRVIQRLLRRPQLGPLVARLGTRALFARSIRQLFADPGFLDQAELDAMWRQLTAEGGRDILALVSRYLDERHKFWHRWIGALQTTQLPVQIVWARQDPVAVEEMAHVLASEIPNHRIRLLDGVGHFPMIESARDWTDAVMALIDDAVRENEEPTP